MGFARGAALMRGLSRTLRVSGAQSGRMKGASTLFRDRTVAASSAEAETWAGIFDGHFLSSDCGVIANQAALPDE
jgi:hypothetical protein